MRYKRIAAREMTLLAAAAAVPVTRVDVHLGRLADLAARIPRRQDVLLAAGGVVLASADGNEGGIVHPRTLAAPVHDGREPDVPPLVRMPVRSAVLAAAAVIVFAVVQGTAEQGEVELSQGWEAGADDDDVHLDYLAERKKKKRDD